MDSTALCVRASSTSPPASLVAPVAVKPNILETPSPQIMTHAAAAAAAVEQQRLQQLYQLAIAERLRLASGLTWPRPQTPFENGNGPPQLLPHPALNVSPNVLAAAGHGYMYPWRFVDPRSLYRVPEEPKPQHSYIGLIAMAILSSADKKLVLSDIYAYILDNYAYFRTRGPGWRNSIRHNLSLNDCFVKAGRSANGKGHYWAIHPANLDDFARGDFRRRRAQRRVRKHMGLQVDDDSSPEPPATSSPAPTTPTESTPHLVVTPTSLLTSPPPPQGGRKRQFDVASLLAPDDLPPEALLKSRRFRVELSPTPLTVPATSPGRESPERGLRPKEEFPEDIVTHGPIAEEARSTWPLLGWPQGHSWTILTPPQEENDPDRDPSSPDH